MSDRRICRTVWANGHRTSLRLEASIWSALADICSLENKSVNDVCDIINTRMAAQRDRQVVNGDRSRSFSSAVRLFVLAYYRRVSTEEGHLSAGHGDGKILDEVRSAD